MAVEQRVPADVSENDGVVGTQLSRRQMKSLPTGRDWITAESLMLWGWVSAFLGCLASLAAWRVAGRRLVERMYEGQFQSFFIIPPLIRDAHSADELFHWMFKALLLAAATTFAASACFLVVQLRKYSQHAGVDESVSWLEWLAWPAVCTVCCFLVLYWQGYNSKWYPVQKAMSFTADPPYVHRVLFVLLAKLIHAVTGQPDLTCFYVSQFVAMALAMIAVRKWAEVFVSKRISVAAPILLTAILAPTLTYFTFYDVGIVFFYSVALTLLYQRKYGWYLLTIGLATLNHENILLLIAASAIVLFGRHRWITWVAAQVAIYGAVRAILFHLIPVSRAWAKGNVWINVAYVLVQRQDLVQTAVLFLWFGAALYFAFTSAAAELKPLTLLFPMLLGTTVLVGQLNEARQFDAFIPVAIVLILSGLSALASRKSPSASVSAETASDLPEHAVVR